MPTILVVEDDPHVRRLASRALQMAGYHVCEAVDGIDAQLQFAQCAPDLVLTDLHMPGLDGAELAQWVHTQKAIPVVLMTAAMRRRNLGSVMADGSSCFERFLGDSGSIGTVPGRYSMWRRVPVTTVSIRSDRGLGGVSNTRLIPH